MQGMILLPLAAIDAFDQSVRNWGQQFSWPAEQLLRLLLAAAAGGLVGLEREVRGRQAGFRTNLLVAVGSALVMLVSISFTDRHWNHDSSFNLNVDPARIAYGVMTGIGFLCAGTIIKHEASVRGLTTAAGIWCVAAVGLAAGFGLYSITVFATVIIVASLWILDYFENILPKMRYRTIVIRRPWKAGCVREIVERLKAAGIKVIDASFDRSRDPNYADVSVDIAFIDRAKYYALEREFENDATCELVAAREE